MKKLIVSVLLICLLLSGTNNVYAVLPESIYDNNIGVLTDKDGNTRHNYSTYDKNAVIKYESDTYFYIDGVDKDVSLTEIAEATGKNFNGADTISGFKYNNPAATDSVEINDIIDTLVTLGYGNDVRRVYQTSDGVLQASSYNTIRAYNANTGDADSGLTFRGYDVSLKYPENENTQNKLDSFLTDISWGDTEAVRNTALYSISGTTTYMPELTSVPVIHQEPTVTPIITIAVSTPTPLPPTPTEQPSVGIYYDGNGADGGSTWSSNAYYNGTFIVSQNGFFKNGYHDVGYWTTDRDGKGERIYPGETVTLSVYYGKAWITLYAQWESNTYIVDFDYNADFCLKPETLVKGDVGEKLTRGTEVNVYYSPYEYRTYVLLEDNAIIKAGDNYNLPKPDIEGYTFVNWSFRELESGNGFWGNYCTEETVCTIAENHTLYAVWKPNEYNVSFDFNFDSMIPSVLGEDAFTNMSASEYLINYGETLNFIGVPERKGYDFTGWYLAEVSNDGRGDVIRQDSIFDKTDNIMLYAGWKPVKINLTMDLMNGNEVSSEKVEYGQKLDDILFVPEKTGYLFIGWNTATDGSGKQVNESDISLFTTDTRIYAMYEPLTYETGLDYNLSRKLPAVNVKGTDLKKITITNGESFPKLPAPEREGYYFMGWYTIEDDGSYGERITRNSKVDEICRNGIKARWIPELVKVIYDYNDYEDYSEYEVEYGP